MLFLYNTLTRTKEVFQPINNKRVNFFVCGPTVYDFPHLGHAKTYTQFDLIARYLRYKGYEVFYLQNITDVDDKIIDRANKLAISWKELSTKFENIYKEDMKLLENSSVNEYARASDFMPQIINQIKTLLEKGYAYKTPDGIYYEVSKFNEYGKLSGRTELKEEDSISRIDESGFKRGWNDFCLWKAQKPNEPFWDPSIWLPRQGSLDRAPSTGLPRQGSLDRAPSTGLGTSRDKSGQVGTSRDKSGQVGTSRDKSGQVGVNSEIGSGRPGWHIEDTAITESYFGPQYDIHGGAVDLIFPHHECEIAQMEAISGQKPLVKYWLHTGFLNIDTKKMAKSTGNFFTLEDVIDKGFSPLAVRYLMLGTHYRKPLNFTWLSLEAAQNTLNKLNDQYKELGETMGGIEDGYRNKFVEAMDNDFETPQALALMWDLIKDQTVSKENKKTTLLDFDKVLGLGLDKIRPIEIPVEVMKLVEEREMARKEKDFKKSDELRDQIQKLGFSVKDTSEGPKISKTSLEIRN